MSDITLSKNEFSFLKDKILIKHPLDKINSNVANYETLCEEIKKTTGRDISERFLKCFFYEYSRLGKDTFRGSNIDTLYLYITGKTREKYGHTNFRKHFVYSINLTEEEKQQIEKKIGERDIGFLDIRVTSLQEIKEQAKHRDQVVHIYINDAILKDKIGALHLVKLLSDNILRSLIDLDFKFHFSHLENGVLTNGANLDNIVTSNGRMRYLNFWRDEYLSFMNSANKFKELEGNVEDVGINNFLKDLQEEFNREENIYQELSGVKFFMTLKTLNEIQARNRSFDEEEGYFSKMSIRFFQPFWNEAIHSVEPQPLRAMYEKVAEVSSCDFLGVIGYEDYFKKGEEYRMTRYFLKLNQKIRKSKHRIFRFFTLPARRVKHKGWTSALDFEGNKLLFAYLYANFRSNAKTYLFMYNKEEVKPSSELFLLQDYVIRLSQNKSNINRLIEGKVEDDFSRVIQHDMRKDLYTAYPPDELGNHQLLHIRDYPSILRYYRDFRHRLEYLHKEDEKIQVIEIKNESTLDNMIASILGINVLEKNTSKQLKIRVRDIEKEIQADNQRRTKFKQDEIEEKATLHKVDEKLGSIKKRGKKKRFHSKVSTSPVPFNNEEIQLPKRDLAT